VSPSRSKIDPAEDLASMDEPVSPLLDPRSGAPLALPSIARAVHWYDLAQLVALGEAGVIDAATAAACLRILRAADPDGGGDGPLAAEEHWHRGESLLVRELGPEGGGMLDAGRSRHDLFGVVWRIQTREALLAVLEALGSWREALLEAANRGLHTVLPDFARGEGQVTTVGHQLHGFAVAAERDHARLEAAFLSVNTSPAGAAAGVGTLFPIDRARLAALLGFDGTAANTRDALHNDAMWEAAGATAILVANLVGFADQLFTWHRLGFVDVADRSSSEGSPAPGRPAGSVLGELARLAHARTGGRAHVNHPVEDWDEQLGGQRAAFWLLRVLASVVGDLELHTSAMAEAAATSWGHLADLGAILVRERGLSWRAAHRLVAAVARRAEERAVAPRGLTADLIEDCARDLLGRPVQVASDQIERALDAAARVDRRAVLGGPSPLEMRAQITEARSRLVDERRELAVWRGRLVRVEPGLRDADRDG